MEPEELKKLVQKIVEESNKLKNKYTSEKDAQVNYACIFCQDENQYQELTKLCENIGNIVEETPTGLIFQIPTLGTIAGKLKLLKIRKPDKTRKELGDADFTISNFAEFKKKYLPNKKFKLIIRENFEMIELTDKQFKVRTYFSNPPLDKQLKIN